MNFKTRGECDVCHSVAHIMDNCECFCGAQEALKELVELKRMKDSGTTPAEYERRKLQAWREAFRVCGVIGEPKP